MECSLMFGETVHSQPTFGGNTKKKIVFHFPTRVLIKETKIQGDIKHM